MGNSYYYISQFNVCRLRHSTGKLSLLVSGIGMFVGVYGYGYWVVSKYPRQYPQLVVIGLMDKVLGPVGWAYHVYAGDVPLKTMWVNVFNDFIWIPFFISYLLWHKNLKKEIIQSKNFSPTASSVR